MSALRIKRLAVRAMPGFRMGEGFTLDDLDHDVIVVLGPNGSGKSTTARAVTHLLWPDLDAQRSSYLDAEFAEGNLPRTATLDAGHIQWQSNGLRSEGPLVGDRERAGHYLLALPELFSSTNSRDLTEAVRQELVGGYDLKRAANLKGDIRKRPRGLETALTQAKNAVSAAINRERDLRQRANEQDRLVRERKDLDEALAGQSRWEADLRLREAMRKHREAWRATRAFPRVLAKLRKDEVALAEELKERLEQALREWKAVGEASARLSPTGLPAMLLSPPPASLEAEIEGALEAWNAAEERLSRAKATVAESERKLQATRESIAREFGREIEPEVFDRLRNLPHRALVEELRGSLEAQALLRALEEQQSSLRPIGEGTSVERSRRALEQLIDWLRQPEPDTAKRSPLPLIVGVVAILLGFPVMQMRGISLLAGVLWGVGITLIGMHFGVRKSTSSNRREEIERSYVSEGFGELDWSQRDLVWRRLDFHREELALATYGETHREHWQARRGQIDTVRQSLVEAQNRVADLGLPEDSHASIARLLATFDEVSRAETDHAAAADTIHIAEREVAVARERVARHLAPFGFECPETVGATRRVVAVLREWSEATAQSVAAYRRVCEHRTAIRRQVERHGIADLGQLRELAAKLPAYERAQDAKRAAREALREAALARQDRDLPLAPESELRERLAAMADQRRRREDLTERIQLIRAEVSTAKGNLEVETTLANREKARQDLAEERDRQILASVAEAFAEFVVQESEQSDLPMVFRQAQHLFLEVTQGRYRLEWQEGDFAVVDQVLSRSLPLESLSSGTRVQLLLAVRLAFVQSGESVALPILLDETLATSDPERSAEVIRAIGDLLNNGRQAFYFTTQPDEAKQWETGLPGRVRVIRLDEVRRLTIKPELWQTSEPAETETAIPAPPENRDYEAYRQTLGVAPKIDPRLGVGAVHLWHLFDRGDELFEALKYQRPEWGRFEGLVEKVLEPELAKRVRAKAKAIEAAIATFCIGRPQEPITLETLREAGMTAHFIETIVEHCSDELNRPNDFHRRLQDKHPKTKIPDIRDKARLQLVEYLEQKQRVDLRPALGAVSVEDRVVDLLSDAVQAGDIHLSEIQRIVQSLPFERQADQQTLDF